jgi:hypothetical protein
MNLKRTGVIAGLLGLAAVMTGCGIAGPVSEEKVSYDVSGVTALQVEADSGTVEVIESDREGVRVTETLIWTSDKPNATHDSQGGTLVLKFTCPGSWALNMSCDVSYRVEVPRGVRVKARTDSGEVTLQGLSGEVDASSDSGRIQATGLGGKNVIAKTDSGSIELAFTAVPDRVQASSDSGSSEVRVPQGPYNITATSDSGQKEIEAAHDPAAQRTINVTSDSGSVAVLPS